VNRECAQQYQDPLFSLGVSEVNRECAQQYQDPLFSLGVSEVNWDFCAAITTSRGNTQRKEASSNEPLTQRKEASSDQLIF